jgi:hypothetical protein
MWERFSYYGMRAILVLYLVNALQWDIGRAASLYGTYTMAVYLTPLVGGDLADRVIGTRRSLVLGGAIIALGHFSLAFPGLPMFYAGLALIVVGTGFFKPNVSTMVGQMYAPGDQRRDSAFTIFYMGINLGALGGPFVCGLLAQADGRMALGVRGGRRGHGVRARHVPVGPGQVPARHRSRRRGAGRCGTPRASAAERSRAWDRGRHRRALLAAVLSGLDPCDRDRHCGRRVARGPSSRTRGDERRHVRAVRHRFLRHLLLGRLRSRPAAR